MDDEQSPGGVVKKIMYLNRRAPHGSIYPQEALETVLIGAAFDQDVSVAFIDDGVYQLKTDQDPSSTGLKNFSKAFRALDDYDVEKLYVDAKSLAERGLRVEDLLVEVEVVEEDTLAALMDEQDIVLSF